jgi:hypothetical protein
MRDVLKNEKRDYACKGDHSRYMGENHQSTGKNASNECNWPGVI